MKKNDFATFIVYVAMFAVALLVGLLVIKPIIDKAGSMTISPIVIMILGLFAGVLINGLILELGHALGAKAGKYTVTKCIVLGVGAKRVDGKLRFAFSGFDGLVGETKVLPKDPKTSNLSLYIFFPVLFLFAEVILCMIGVVYCQNRPATDNSFAWLHILLITILTVGGMVFLYDLFPAHIESVTDGYLLVLLSKPANKEAYNNLLLAEASVEEGKPLPEMPVYEEITDFTAGLNMLTVYRLLTEGKPAEALKVLEPIVAAEQGVSGMTKMQAIALKQATLLESENKEKGKKFYEELDDDAKKYIANVSDLTALRTYLLIACFIEGSESESNYAIDKAEKAIKACEPSFKEAEKSLLQLDVDLARAAHPAWDLYRLPWEEEPKGEEE